MNPESGAKPLKNLKTGAFPHYQIFVCSLSDTRYTVRGRGAKRRTSSALTRTYLTCLWSKTTCIRLTAYARLRHIGKNFQEVPYQGEYGGSMFVLTRYKKVPETVSKTGPWTDRYQLLKHLRAVHFSILQNQEWKSPVDSSSEAALRSSRQKSIISVTEHEERTSEFDVQHGWNERFAQLSGNVITMSMKCV